MNRAGTRLLAAGFAVLGVAVTGQAVLAQTAPMRSDPAARPVPHRSFPARSTAAAMTAGQLRLRVTLDPKSTHFTDYPPKGPSVGDVFVYSATLREDGRVVGRLEGSSTAADPKYRGNISTQYYVLHDGTIAVQGGGQSGAPGVGRPDSRIFDAIVGGTGKFTGVGGWVSGRDVNETTLIVTLHLRR
jgi:hypothetical protein